MDTKELKKEIKLLEEKKSQLDTDISHRANLINSANLDIENKEKERQAKLQEIKDVEFTLSQIETRNKDAVKVLAELNTKLKGKNNYITLLDQQIAWLEEKKVQEKQTFDENVKSNQEVVSQLEQKIKTLESEIKELNNQIQKTGETFADELLKIKREIDNSKQQKSDLDELIKTNQIVYLNAQEEVVKAEEVLTTLNDKINTAQGIVVRLEGVITVKKDEEKALSISITNEKEILDNIKVELETIKEEAEGLKQSNLAKIKLIRAMEHDKECIINEGKIVGYSPQFVKYE